MSWRTNAIVVSARNVGRALGVNKAIAKTLSKGGYEAAFDTGFSRTLRPGDCVWDVGANVGRYAEQFARKVGESGLVFAFEPSPATYPKLVEACASLSNVRPIRTALGREAGALPFAPSMDDLGVGGRIVASGGADAVMVDVRPGAALVEGGVAGRPNAVKIDVEGFELEVLEGLDDLIADPSLRVIGVEVHFRILDERGMKQAPKAIEALLANAGFDIAWPDASHVVATRPGR